MKKILSLLFIILFNSATAFASTKITTPVVKEETPVVATATNSAIQEGHRFGVDFGAGIFNPKFHFGAGLRLDFPVVVNANVFWVGGQTGFYFGPTKPTSWVVPVLVTGTYEFMSFKGTWKPYIGAGMGAAIVSASALGITATTTLFDCRLKVGFSFGEDQKNYFEIPLGTVDGTFMMIPSIGFRF